MLEGRQPSSVEGIKRLAKAIKASQGVQHKDALEAAARQAGFSNYTHAHHSLAKSRSAEVMSPIPSAPKPPDMVEAGGRASFLEGCRRAWVETLEAIDPDGREHLQWDRAADIKVILDALLSRTRSHAHLPTGGGQDFTHVQPSHERGLLEFEIERGLVYVAKPRRLVMQRVPASTAESFFLLELADLDPCGAYPPDERPTSERDWMSRREEVVELAPRQYAERYIWDEGVFGHDEEGAELPLPRTARLVVRWFDGSILFVTKGSMWNGTPSTYDGRHGFMSPAAIRAMIERSLPGPSIRE